MFELPKGGEGVDLELLLREMNVTLRRGDQNGAHCACSRNVEGTDVVIDVPEGAWLFQVYAFGGSFRWPAEGALDVMVTAGEETALFIPTDQIGGVHLMPREGDDVYGGSAIVRCSPVDKKRTIFLQFDKAPYIVWGLTPEKWDLSVSKPDDTGYLVPGGGSWVEQRLVEASKLTSVDME